MPYRGNPVVGSNPTLSAIAQDPAWLAGWPDAIRTNVRVIGPRFREDQCLQAAEAIEAGAPPPAPIDPRQWAAGPRGAGAGSPASGRRRSRSRRAARRSRPAGPT